MCGIFGYIWLKKGLIKNNYQNSMNLLRHRGPDDQGGYYWSDSSTKLTKELDSNFPHKLFLGHKRLAILDLTQSGWQPMLSYNERYIITFNGEIYNYLELREELKFLGYNFYTNSDTEVLLNSYINWGKNCLNKLLGMFAFAIFDKETKEIFIARDFFGIKPLYYVVNDDFICFSSEIKPLLNIDKINKTVNPQVVFNFLNFATTEMSGETIYKQINQVNSAHYIKFNIYNFEQKDLLPNKYWFIGKKIIKSEISYLEAVKNVRDLFLRNMNFHMRSDVKVGAALSGGIDSSSIVMAMKYLKPNLDLYTFSFISNDAHFSEEKWVDIVNYHSKAKSFKINLSEQELVDEYDELIKSQEQPFGSSSIFAQRKIMEIASKNGIKVMLDGQGADELFAGYHYFSRALIASMLKKIQIKQALSFKKNLKNLPNREVSWLHVFMYLIPNKIKFLIPILKNILFTESTSYLINKKWFLERNVNIYETQIQSYGKQILIDQLTQSLTKTSLPDLLRYEDRNSMQFSIESRVPFLSPEIVEFVYSLPEHYLINHEGITKSIFRDAMREIVPEEILNRKDKIAFTTPEQKWFSNLRPWVSIRLSDESIYKIPFLNYESIISKRNEFLEGKTQFCHSLWKVMNIIRWSEINEVDFT